MGRAVGIAIFLTVAIAIVAAIHSYFYLRLIRDTQIQGSWRLAALSLLVLLALSLPASFLLQRLLPLEWSRTVLYLPYTWMGVMLLLFTALMLGEAARLGSWVAVQLMPAWDGPWRQLPLARGLASAALILTLLASAWALAIGLQQPRVKEVPLQLPGLHPSLGGLRVVQLTDLHIGPLLGRDWLDNVVTQVNALEPDLVAITGDLIDGEVPQLWDEMAPLKKLRPRLGVYFVTGNHEYYFGAQEWIAALPRLGVRVLQNERLTLGEGAARFTLAGIPDPTAKRMDPEHAPALERALAGREPDLPVVLLAHQPRAIDEAADAGVALQLSGHTHGGQIWPWYYFVYLQQPYVAGLVRRGQTQLYISDGTGFWGPPMRLGTRGEITLITLEPER